MPEQPQDARSHAKFGEWDAGPGEASSIRQPHSPIQPSSAATTALDLVRERRDALRAAGCTPTQAYVIALEERLLDEYGENQRLWDQQPEATV